MLYNKFRPKLFKDVVGQEGEMEVLKAVLERRWRPAAILLAGGYGCGKCVTGDSLIHTRQGLVRIDSLHEGEEEDSARPLALDVVTPSGWQQTSHFYYGGVKPTLRACLDTGQEIKGTYVHPIQVMTDRGFEWVQLQYLQPGSFVVVKPTPFEGTGGLDSLGYYLGFCVGAGSYDGPSLMLRGSGKTLQTLLAIQSFGDEKWHREVKEPLWSIRTKLGRTFLARDGIGNSAPHSKSLPAWVMTASQDVKLSILRGLLDADGSVETAEFNTDSEVLARQVQSLLLAVGLLSQVKSKRGLCRGSWRVCLDQVQLRRYPHNLGEMRDWSVWTKEGPTVGTRGGLILRPGWLRNWARTYDTKGLPARVKAALKSCAAFGPARINRETVIWLVEALGCDDPRLLFFSECSVAEVESVQDNGLQEVYDLTVPEGSSFVANGIVVHNTTLARLIARALLCDNRDGIEPCGQCPSCLAMDTDSNSAYLEIDSASNGLVDDIRALKDEATYHAVGGKSRIVVLDESHMISTQGQNAMLQLLEDEVTSVLFMFATTDPERMLPTILSRCVVLNLKLLTAAEIYGRLKVVCEVEGCPYEDKALRVISTYVRGHMRDALVLLEQLMRSTNAVTEEAARAYLRLDRLIEFYELLTEPSKVNFFTKLEHLLCQYSPGDLTDGLGQVLLNCYKQQLGLTGDFSQVDGSWMKRVTDSQGVETLLAKSEALLSLHTDFASIQFGLAAITRILEPGAAEIPVPARGLMPGSSHSAIPSAPNSFRKPAVVKP